MGARRNVSPRELLGPDGRLARALPHYEVRRGQLDMADAVARALDEDRVVLCEASTGTGKTLAYLVPALMSGRRVVVSTASRALQEQIYFKDLPMLERHLELEVRAELVKGLSNYLCLRRFNDARERSNVEGSDVVKHALPVVTAWAERTNRGDVCEVATLPEDHPVWSRVTSSSDTRIGSGCSYHDACFVTALKRAQRNAQLLVVNHHLFFADLSLRNGSAAQRVLPDYDAVIFDEAHRIEDVATQFFGARVASSGMNQLVKDLTLADGGARLAKRLRDACEQFFGAVNLLVGSADARVAVSEDDWAGSPRDAYHALDDVLEATAHLWAGQPEEAGHERNRKLSERAARLRGDLAAIIDGNRARVTWAERRGQSVQLASSPVNVGPMLRNALWSSGRPVVLTSASLSASGSFEFVRSRLGLEEALETPVDEIAVEAAIDHSAQAVLYTPVDLPGVDEVGFVTAAVDRIGALDRLSPGGAFVLCTSMRAVKRFAREFEARGREVLVQGAAPKHVLLNEFRRRGDCLLIATMSFWEGVDVPGEALQLVVIDRIPFAVPTDPLVMARASALERSGGQPFREYAVPSAALTLKQGYGRLLRTRDDRGVVAVLDQRIVTRAYGRALIDSLPGPHHTTALTDVADFWSRPSVSPR